MPHVCCWQSWTVIVIANFRGHIRGLSLQLNVGWKNVIFLAIPTFCCFLIMQRSFTSAPLPNTVGAFWRMAWETNVECIVMLTNLVGESKVRYASEGLAQCHGNIPVLLWMCRRNVSSIGRVWEAKNIVKLWWLCAVRISGLTSLSGTCKWSRSEASSYRFLSVRPMELLNH